MKREEDWKAVAERRLSHIQLRDQQLKNCGERIAHYELLLGSEWNHPMLFELLEKRPEESLLDAARVMRAELNDLRIRMKAGTG